MGMMQPGQMPGQPWGNNSSVPGQMQAPAGAPAAASGSPLAKLKQEFSSFSPVKRLTLVLLVFAIPASGFFLLANDDEPTGPAAANVSTQQQPAASAAAANNNVPPVNPQASAAAQAAGTHAPGMPNAGGQPASVGVQGFNPANAAPSAASTAASASGAASGKRPAPPPQTPAAPAVSGVKLPSELPALATTVPMPAQKSLERLASDAVAEGQFDVAAGYYDQLAQQFPNEPKYREAARILRGQH